MHKSATLCSSAVIPSELCAIFRSALSVDFFKTFGPDFRPCRTEVMVLQIARALMQFKKKNWVTGARGAREPTES